MAQTYGFDGTVDEVAMAKMIDFAGVDYAVQTDADWKVTAVAGADRTVKVAAGTGYGHFVLDESMAEQTIQLDNLSSGKRWDLICRRRNWQPPGGTSVFAKVTGTAAADPIPAIPNGRVRGPGVQDDQPLALVQVVAGQSLPAQIIDLRYRAVRQFSATSLVALPDAKLGDVALIGDAQYRRELDSALNPTWTKQDVWQTSNTGVLTLQTGWDAVQNLPSFYKTDRARTVARYELMLRRSGATFRFGSDGGIGDVPVCTLIGPQPDFNGLQAQPVQFRYIGGPATNSITGLGCTGYLRADGLLCIEAGPANSYLIQRPTLTDWSLRASIDITVKG